MDSHPTNLEMEVNSFSLFSIDDTVGIEAGRPYEGRTFTWHYNFGYNTRVKRYEFIELCFYTISHEADHTCKLEHINTTQGMHRFNEMFNVIF